MLIKKLRSFFSSLVRVVVVGWLVGVCQPFNYAHAQTILLSENFEGWTSGNYGAQASGWVSIKVPTNGTSWGTTTLSIAHSGTKSIYAPLSVSDYMITNGHTLTANVPYTFSFWYRTYSAGTGFTVNVYVGTGQTVNDMTGGTLLATFDPNSTVFLPASYTFTPTVTGTYYFCVNSTAGGSGPTYTYIDDILLTAPNCPAPCLGWLSQNCTTCTKGCFIDAGTISPARTLQTSIRLTDTSNYGYLYWTFNASADSTYYFDLCSSTGTSGTAWLRLHDARNVSPGNNYCMNVSNTPTMIMQNIANGCAGTGTGLSKLIWTCPASGTYYLESSVGANKGYWGAQGSQTGVLSYKTLPSSSVICSDIFYDKGIDGYNGASNNYNNNESWTYTYSPTDSLIYYIVAQFISFSTSPGDVLCVYDGNSVNAPIIGCYAGPSITGTFSSTASDGSLTFKFSSDDSLVSSGWEANIQCYPLDIGIGDFGRGRISISPNPVNDKMEVSYSGSLDLTSKDVEIYNVVGERVSSRVSYLRSVKSSIPMDVSSLPSGVYVVRVNSPTGSWNGRFIKN